MANDELLPVYLMNGADEFKREFLVERLTARIAALGDIDFNKDVFAAASVGADELLASCNTLPFACPYRLVVVKDADRLSKAVQEALVSYLDDPSATTVLALTAAKLAKNTRLYKAVARAGDGAVVDCSPKSRRELPAQVRDFAKARGVEITRRAAEELISRVGESTLRLDAELEKMAAALGAGATIDAEHVERFVTRTSEVKPWEFVDALCARDARTAALLLSRMPGQSPYGLLALSLNRLRELLVAKDLGRAGGSVLAAELGVPAWRVKNHARWAAGFTSAELEKALVDAAELERSMKSGGEADRLFEQWALRLCARV